MIYQESIEFIFSFVYRKYQKWGEKNIADVYALCITSTFQVFNILTLFLICLLLNFFTVDKSLKYYFLLAFLLPLLANYYYIYKHKTKNVILEKYSVDNEKTKRIKKVAIIYVIVTVISFSSCFIYYLKS